MTRHYTDPAVNAIMQNVDGESPSIKKIEALIADMAATRRRTLSLQQDVFQNEPFYCEGISKEVMT